MGTLAEVLEQQTREGQLCEPLDRERVRCYACGHRCSIPQGALGVCKVRFNKGGRLYVPWGYVGGVQCDPVEKKPFFHAYPGALAYSFGMLGCDLHCSYCQNWVTSQALRDPHAVSRPMGATPEAVVRDAVEQGAQIMVSTYNEPLITSEWAVAIFRAAKAAGLMTGFVSNGNGTPQVLEYLRPWIDLYTRISDFAVVPYGQDSPARLDFWGSDVGNPATEGDTLWVNYSMRRFSSRSMAS